MGLSWGLLAQEFCWGCIFLRTLEFYVKSFGVWNIHVKFGGTWFVVRIVCVCVIDLWLILWRDQYVYLFYHMEEEKKSPTVSLEGLVSHALNPFRFGAWHRCLYLGSTWRGVKWLAIRVKLFSLWNNLDDYDSILYMIK